MNGCMDGVGLVFETLKQSYFTVNGNVHDFMSHWETVKLETGSKGAIWTNPRYPTLMFIFFLNEKSFSSQLKISRCAVWGQQEHNVESLSLSEWMYLCGHIHRALCWKKTTEWRHCRWKSRQRSLVVCPASANSIVPKEPWAKRIN